MASAVHQLVGHLEAMLSLKPPGVSGTRIQTITALCNANVESESALIQKLYTHFKKAPPTHKLGVLYVVDSVTRKWTEQAKNNGQTINSAAQDGSYAAGVHRVTELLPVLMNDLIQSAPADQKEKIKKLVEIWEKGQTFPLQMLTGFKEKLNAAVQNASFTPEGSPPADPLGLQKPSAPPAAEPASILAALGQLANMARQNSAAHPAPAPMPITQNMDSYMSNAHPNPTPQAAVLNQTLPFPPVLPPVNVPAAFAPQNQAHGLNNGAQSFASSLLNPFAGHQSLVPPPPTALDPAVQQQLMLIKTLADAGVAPDQIAGILASMGAQGPPRPGPGGLPLPPAPFPFPFQNPAPQNGQNGTQNGWGGAVKDESRDHRMEDGLRSPSGRYAGRRSRSRSPPRAWNGHGSPAGGRRDGPNADYDRDSPGRDRGRGRGAAGRGNDYRQRSPPRRNPSPAPGVEKWVGRDDSIGKGNIKVLSRTLFVGGVTMPDQELRKIFEQYGIVQTCIVNKEKRHAFVKMLSRNDAQTAKDGMERNRTPDSQLRTRWGVGFGPRDCSDYQTGVSIIPIGKLTDADRKWMLTAEYGGSGGKPIEPGMVVEEPDIEIGQGVSSKAISRRMQTDTGGQTGPKSSRDREEEEPPRRNEGRRGSRDDQRDNRRGGGSVKKERNSNISGPPSMPPIPPFGISGFPFTLPNGMPMLPPGFSFPAPTPAAAPAQPPPPGRS